jgi:hypothetical protein
LAGSYAQIIVPAIHTIVGAKIGESMFKAAASCAMLLSALLPNAAVAEPIELKLATDNLSGSNQAVRRCRQFGRS